MTNTAFHLPGRHNQKAHGNRKGRPNNIASKYSKIAPMTKDEIRADNAKAPPAEPAVVQKQETKFERDVASAKKNADVFSAVSHGTRTDLLKAYDEESEDAEYVPADVVDEALDHYQGGGAYDMNEEMRDGETDGLTGEYIDAIDQVMKMSELTDDVVLYRGVGSPTTMFAGAWNPDGDNSGLEWTDPGYTSASADVSMALTFAHLDSTAEEEGLLMRMVAPKGTPALVIDKKDPWRGYQSEILLNRQMRFRAVRDYMIDGQQRVIDVEVIWE